MSHPVTVGIHIDGARRRGAVADSREPDPLSGPWVRDVVRRADIAGFSFATFAGSHLAQGVDRLDPVQLAAFAGPLTSAIALIPEIPVTYVEPFHTSTQLASLDFVSGGRGGWLVSVENSDAAARQFGRTALEPDELASEVIDVVAAVRRLWDTWEDDAVIRDFATGRYIDRDLLHYAEFSGRSFSITGPAITPRPPQGQLPVLVPLAHASGVDADAVLVDAGPGFTDDVASARALQGSPLVIADLEVALDSRGERFGGSAEELIERVNAVTGHVDGVRLIPLDLERDLDELQHVVLPTLIETGVFAPPSRTHARSTFGLSHAPNVFAASRSH